MKASGLKKRDIFVCADSGGEWRGPQLIVSSISKKFVRTDLVGTSDPIVGPRVPLTFNVVMLSVKI